ncbi:Isochorismatase-like protein [Pilaira anomala]|nr:Isochorismatase-like protein [Pilaira anomala]
MFWKSKLGRVREKALIVVDVQNDYFPDGKLPTWRPVETAEHIATLIKKFRDDGKEVIYVQHIIKDPEAFPFLVKGTHGAEINDIVKPLPTDKIVTKEENSSFVRTELKEYLLSKGITNLVVVGMMIHNCVNATVYSAVEEGFPSIVVDECVNTMDQPLYGEVVKAEDIKRAFLTGIQFGFSVVYKLDDIMSGNYKYRAL